MSRVLLGRSTPLDIVFVHPNTNKRIGGIATAGLTYVRALLTRGHRVEVWTASPAVAERARTLGVEVVYDRRLRSWAATLSSAKLRRHIFAARRRGVDAFIHNTGRLWPLVWLGLGSQRQFVVFHNEKIAGRGFFRHLLAITSTQVANLTKARRTRPWIRTISHVKNGLAPVQPAPIAERADDCVILGSLADGGVRKGVDILVAAAAILRDRGYRFRFRIGGDDPELDKQRVIADAQGLADCFEWVGWVEDIDRYYAGIDLYCLPSRAEAFPLVMLEAMARGKPVVVTSTEGPADLLSGRPDLGWLVPIDDPAAYARAVAEALDDPVRREKVAAAGAWHVAQEYGDTAVGIALENALRHVVGCALD